MRIAALLTCAALLASCANADLGSGDKKSSVDPGKTGRFLDDYGSAYVISDSLWTQDESYSFHISTWDTLGRTIIAQNDSGNPTEPGLYSRIDYLDLDMDPYTWAFCLTSYNANSPEEAMAAESADRSNPREGCAGFPFTRMRPVNTNNE